MDYQEQAPPEHLRGLVKSFWSLEGSGEAGQWVQQNATPDGCVELIRRIEGRSRWGDEQPELFVTGLVDHPIAFEVTAQCRFAAVRIWPWAWPLFAARPLSEFRNSWLAYPHPLLALLPDFEVFAERMPQDADIAALGQAILAANSVAEIVTATKMHPRALQRWFATNVGLSPRRYLQILRFQDAFEGVSAVESLAGHAAAAGYADQAHMSRTFRSLAGVPAAEARASASGPFLPGPGSSS